MAYKNPEDNKANQRKHHQQSKLTNPDYMMKRMLAQAKLRCTDPARDSYNRYGSRGIKFLITDIKTFCNQFRADTQKIMDDGKVPSLDRKDPDGHYEIDNIRIITVEENTKEVNVRNSAKYAQKRILAESQPNKTCNTCSKSFPTADYYIHKKHPDGTVTRYSRCPECEQSHRSKTYGNQSYYKGRT